MKNIYTLHSADPVVRFIQITDPHLLANPHDTFLGVNTAQSFYAVLDDIQHADTRFDFVLATGDLIQEGAQQAYHHFALATEHLAKPLFWLAGNHDFQPAMIDTLAQYAHIQPCKHVLAGEHWQILMLDSQVANSPHGFLSDYQLEWLMAKLAQQPTRYSLIALHHNILPTYSTWLDQHSLRNVGDLEEALKPFNNVKAIMHGHIHQAVDSQWLNYRILATPSTCIQFKPHCHNFTLDTVPPGWREVALLPNGEIETSVHRLPDNHFMPDLSVNGY